MLLGKIFIYLPSTFLYQVECKAPKVGKVKELNQYWVVSLPVNLGLGYGVGSLELQKALRALNFKCNK